MPSMKPLFTLQHSSLSQSATGNDVASVCFLPNVREVSHKALGTLANNAENGSVDDYSTDSDSDSDFELQFKSRTMLMAKHSQSQHLRDSHALVPANQHRSNMYTAQHISSARDALASLSFASMQNGHLTNTLLASTHASGNAYIWDLTSRRVIHTLQDGVGPGLAVGRVNYSDNEETASTSEYLFHQRRNTQGSISILDPNNDFKIVRRMECHSQTFCHATTGGSTCTDGNRSMRDLLLSPSQHQAFAQLWDMRMPKSIGVVHGAKMDERDLSHWNDEGMLMSLDLCHGPDSCFIGCGMESGNVFLHDLRMLNGNGPSRDLSESKLNVVREFKTQKDVIDSDVCSVSLGKDPILCLDMCRSHDKDVVAVPSTAGTESNEIIGAKKKQTQSLVLIAGRAADETEMLNVPEEERGTVAVIKATSIKGDNEYLRMDARVRAKVATCKVTSELTREGKPGVGVCRFRPDGKVFAVGGWDKRVRIYSRTSAKLLSIMKGSDASVTALDWNWNSKTGSDDDEFLLSAGSSDGKIALWRPN